MDIYQAFGLVLTRKGVRKMKMSTVDWIAWVLVVLGAVNWGLVGAANLNLVETVVGSGSLAQVVYILVGLGGLYMLWMAVSKKK
jgi:uncharacterized membrane protein YuzA (DUF378 family)